MEAPATVTADAVVVELQRGDEVLFCKHASLWEQEMSSDDMGLDNNGADVLGESKHVCHDTSCFAWPVVRIHGGV